MPAHIVLCCVIEIIMHPWEVKGNLVERPLVVYAVAAELLQIVYAETLCVNFQQHFEKRCWKNWGPRFNMKV